METIFDYNITEEEKESLGCSAFNLELYLKFRDADTISWDLANLFLCRGNVEKAKEYADRLPPWDKQDWYRTINHY